MSMRPRLPRRVRQFLATRGNPSVEVGPEVQLNRTSFLETNGGGTIRIGRNSMVLRNALLQTWGGHITVGERVVIGANSVIMGQGGVTVGNDTMLAPHV